MASSSVGGAASAAPSPATPEDAERLLSQASTPEQAWAIYELASEREEGWRVVKLKAERRYGELLPKPKMGRPRKSDKSSDFSEATYKAQQRARKVAAVEPEDFDAYIAEHGAQSTREGLLREHGKSKKTTNPDAKHARSRLDTPATHKPWKNEAAIAWATRRVKKNATVNDLVEQSAAGSYGWPLEGGLGQNAAEKIKAIAEDRMRRPPEPAKTAGQRIHELHKRRKAGDARDEDLYHARIEIMQMVGILENVDFPALGVRKADQDMVIDIYEDLTRLATWLEPSLETVAGLMDDYHLIRRIELLRNVTVENGAAPAEAASAARRVVALERRLGRVLEA